MSNRPRGQSDKFRSSIWLTAVAVAVTSPAAADWAMYQHDLHHTARTPSRIDPGRLSRSWAAPLGFNFPTVAGRSVIAIKPWASTPTPTQIASFDLWTGKMNWIADDGLDATNSPAIAGDLVVYTTQQLAGGSDSLLKVRNLSDGALRYSVPIPPDTRVMPAVARDPNTGRMVAYLANHNRVSAIELGASGGKILWQQWGEFGGFSMPTVAGDAVVLAGPGHYYAFDRTTGQPNQFHHGDVTGGGGNSVVYDEARRRLYVLEAYSSAQSDVLTAYSMESVGSITPLWQYIGPGVRTNGSIALAEDGSIYAFSSSTLVQIDQDDGSLLRSVTGELFSGGAGPIISDGYLWAYTDSRTLVYDLETLTVTHTFNGSRRGFNNPYKGIGALVDGAFVMFDRTQQTISGFAVYTVPCPGTMVVWLAVFRPRRRR